MEYLVVHLVRTTIGRMKLANKYQHKDKVKAAEKGAAWAFDYHNKNVEGQHGKAHNTPQEEIKDELLSTSDYFSWPNNTSEQLVSIIEVARETFT